MEQKMNPGVREEGIEIVRDALNLMKGYTDEADDIANSALAALSRLAAHQAVAHCTRCGDPIRVGVCENCAPEIEDRLAAQRDEGQDWRLGDRWEGGIKPIASEPRPDDDGIAYRDPTDTIHNHASVSHNNSKGE